MLKFYLRYQKTFEIVFWVGLSFFISTLNATSLLLENAMNYRQIEIWIPFCWEYSSSIVMLVLIPLIIKFDRYFPLTSVEVFRNLFVHFLFTPFFAFLFITGITLLRIAVYNWMNHAYEIGPFGLIYIYEYRKILTSYLLVIAVIYAYRFILERLKGEAKFIAGAEHSSQNLRPETLLVKKLGKEFVVNINDIDWIEAAGNYMNLHSKSRVYPLRMTLSRLLTLLDDEQFVRTHRSQILNVDKVIHLAPLETGDMVATLTTGIETRVSRRYKQALRDRLDNASFQS